MTKLAYFSSTALCALALVAGVTPAAADGGMGHDLFGSANFGYDWTNYDPDGAPDLDTNTFIGQGTFGVPLGGGWSAQGNFSFETQQFDFGPVDFSIDTWQVGGVAGYNFDGQGRIGFDLAYETVDVGLSLDGYRAGMRGEYFWMPNVTLRASAGYQNYDSSSFISADGFYGTVGGSYYFTRNIGLRGNIDYYEYDVDGLAPFSLDYDVWDFGGKLQYKCDEYPLILGAHAHYATIDAFGSDVNAWNLGLDITALFGVGASDASLRDAESNGPFEPMRTGVKYMAF